MKREVDLEFCLIGRFCVCFVDLDYEGINSDVQEGVVNYDV